MPTSAPTKPSDPAPTNFASTDIAPVIPGLIWLVMPGLTWLVMPGLTWLVMPGLTTSSCPA